MGYCLGLTPGATFGLTCKNFSHAFLLSQLATGFDWDPPERKLSGHIGPGKGSVTRDHVAGLD